MFSRLNSRIPRVHRIYHLESIQLYKSTANRLVYQPSYSIVTLIHQHINNDIENYRKIEQFEHIVEQKRDWMSYLVLQITFKKNTTNITLRSYDRVLFGV